MRTKYLASIGLLLLTVSWLAPNHYPPWVNFHSEWLAFAGMGLLLAATALSPDGTLRMSPSAWLFAALVIPVWVQLAWGLTFFAGDAVMSTLYLAGLCGAVLVGNSAGSCRLAKTDLIEAWMHMLWIAALLSAVLALLQWLSLTSLLHVFALHTEPGERVLANLGQPNQLATLLLMGVAALAYIYERRSIGRVGLVTGVAFLTAALVLTESRSGILGALCLAGYLLVKSGRPGLRMQRRLVAAWLLFFFVCLAAIPVAAELLLMGGGRNIELSDSNGRTNLWRQILYGIGQSPWYGYGWNQTTTAQAAAALAYPGSLSISNAHNLGLDLLAWVGVPLGAVLIAVCVYWLVNRLLRARDHHSVYALACLLPLAVHSALEFPFAYSYFLLAAGFLIGVVEAATPTAAPVHSVRPRWAITGLALFAAVGVFLSHEYLLVEEDFRVVRFEMLRVGRTPADYVAPTIVLNTQLRALLAAGRTAATPETTDQELENLRKVAARFTHGPFSYRYALALGMRGEAAQSSLQMQELRGRYGERYYASYREAMRALATEYPVLNAVRLP